jgi:hypothetical protein
MPVRCGKPRPVESLAGGSGSLAGMKRLPAGVPSGPDQVSFEEVTKRLPAYETTSVHKCPENQTSQIHDHPRSCVRGTVSELIRAQF